jgi:5'-3' exonuclease
MCVDISNILYRTFYANVTESNDIIAGLASHSALTTLNKYYRMFKPDKLIYAFDRSSWRKEYTSSDLCISKKLYKGNRRQSMTPGQQAKFERFLGHLREFETLITQYTTIVTLAEERLEADDLIAGFVQKYSSNDNEIVIISADSDLLQLTRYKNVSIISPATDKPQPLDEYYNDPLYYLFSKCIRGDGTDNVQSAFPRVRATRIKLAYDDPYERVKLMKETWTNEHNIEFIVEELFEENQMLIDLEQQPEQIRKKIDEAINREMVKNKQFSMFFILKFLGKYKLKKIQDSIDNYIPMLSK